MKTALLAGVAVLSMISAASAACVMAVPPPAQEAPGVYEDTGLLNMRQRPDNKSKIITALDSGAVMFVDNDPTVPPVPKWTRVYLLQADVEVYGWVYSKYTKSAECKNIATLSEPRVETPTPPVVAPPAPTTFMAPVTIPPTPLINTPPREWREPYAPDVKPGYPKWLGVE